VCFLFLCRESIRERERERERKCVWG